MCRLRLAATRSLPAGAGRARACVPRPVLPGRALPRVPVCHGRSCPAVLPPACLCATAGLARPCSPRVPVCHGRSCPAVLSPAACHSSRRREPPVTFPTVAFPIRARCHPDRAQRAEGSRLESVRRSPLLRYYVTSSLRHSPFPFPSLRLSLRPLCFALRSGLRRAGLRLCGELPCRFAVPLGHCLLPFAVCRSPIPAVLCGLCVSAVNRRAVFCLPFPNSCRSLRSLRSLR